MEVHWVLQPSNSRGGPGCFGDPSGARDQPLKPQYCRGIYMAVSKIRGPLKKDVGLLLRVCNAGVELILTRIVWLVGVLVMRALLWGI